MFILPIIVNDKTIMSYFKSITKCINVDGTSFGIGDIANRNVNFSCITLKISK